MILLVLDGINCIIKAGEGYDGWLMYELLIFSNCHTENPCLGWIEEAGGIEIIDELQQHENEDVYRFEYCLLDSIFAHYSQQSESSDRNILQGRG